MANKIKNEFTVFTPEEDDFELTMGESVKAGFPSPADDFPGGSLKISDYIVKNPASTFYVRVSGDSMIGDGIGDGDILVVDKSVTIYDRCIAVCFIDGEFTVKRVELFPDHALLLPSNPKYAPITITEDNKFIIWGVVRFIIKKVQ